ncbi:heparan-alpha-glucosaminide N-acetyltransferase domain-containing protein [Glutamicibacter sp. JL.03c]|uniref:heparan-alpha-glucosaminide N-acetyltransferase domain-containing protein n=1 Tax=Glutamicibacter sp. JL.03c TaxID=2984842 RepID=UPI0021F75CCF|nr:heparan-alpha-glucosaminide N-acetyltransferase domain-containing protein [Glutamicibacter sp. JL.03c]UYQ78528.1 heparan-alpha-glucosaminide N-acetyltransferase domain-containing protein [Glutamicibacter sp. JL.03c]
MHILGKPQRVLAVDVARLVAILGMFAAHVFPLYRYTVPEAYSPTFTGAVASGRASVLFMVLAGLSLALMSNSLARKGFSHPKIYSVLARRALIIAVLGMAIGTVNEGIAVILVHYGLLFLLLPLSLKLSRPTILVVSASWLVFAPIIWRPLAADALGQSLGHNPGFGDLLHPALLLQDLAVSGYYPLLIWIGYGLLGVALGKCDLESRNTASVLALVGGLVAVASYVAGRILSLGHVEQIAAAAQTDPSLVPTLITTGRLPGKSLDPYLADAAYLWLPTGHSNGLLATVHAAACAVAVIGLLLLIVPRLGLLGQFLAGAGRAPLTLYAGHLVLLPALDNFLEPSTIWWILCAFTACCGLWLGFSKASGPLEFCVRVLSGAGTKPDPTNLADRN